MKEPTEERLDESGDIALEIFHGMDYGAFRTLLASSPSLWRRVQELVRKKKVPFHTRKVLERLLPEME